MLLPHMAENIDARRAEVRGRIANNLKLFRGKQGMSQEKLADRAGLHRTQLSSIERGRSNVMVDTLVALATALGVDAVELLVERNEKPMPLEGGRKRRLASSQPE
ncbi:helix-turn-helix domain-containing protein [Burkholderia cepacia]|uniref:helix-turn-helix domain-containing protein n=1 Tax=Burkholderia cepacia TaxID=292 RepID=UPI000F5E26B9|nr:helix-turn-helix transcriptional regulator [Burkholderia cepacia]RQZ99005.1 XRE family transcriptional regulator [Burkholderia cepacia]RRA03061.1 XRE family transcriptional regulator [Burkholderia cepacia]